MQGWGLFRESVVQVWQRRGAMARAVLPVAVVVFLLELVIAQVVSLSVGQVARAAFLDFQAVAEWIRFNWVLFAILIVANLVIWTTALSVVAVNWHRHVVLDEPVGWRPAFRLDRVYSHTLALIAVVVVSGLLFVVVFWVMSAVGVPSFGWAGVGVMLLVLFALASQFLRFALIMPAAAVGDERDLDAVLPLTDSAAGALFVVAALYGICTVALGVLLGIPATMFVGAWTGVFDVLLTWLSVVLMLSILTTLYRHYIADIPPA